MNKIVYYGDLFEIYKELLTDKEKEYFLLYYYENYSLQEISELKKVSRNAVHKSIKIVEEKLDNYEKKLKILYLKTELIKIDNEKVNNILKDL